MQGGGDVGLAPFHDLHQFFPVIHFFIFHLFYRRTGDNHSVELLIFQYIEVMIERLHVLYRCILRGMTLEFHESHFDLKRRIREETYQVCLGGNLDRHQVEDHNLQRTDVLRTCA